MKISSDEAVSLYVAAFIFYCVVAPFLMLMTEGVLFAIVVAPALLFVAFMCGCGLVAVFGTLIESAERRK